jgi:deoxyribose-phosphate aldolase
VKAMKEACGAAHMKSILAIGELGTMENVYKVSLYILILTKLFLCIHARCQ